MTDSSNSSADGQAECESASVKNHDNHIFRLRLLPSGDLAVHLRHAQLDRNDVTSGESHFLSACAGAMFDVPVIRRGDRTADFVADSLVSLAARGADRYLAQQHSATDVLANNTDHSSPYCLL